MFHKRSRVKLSINASGNTAFQDTAPFSKLALAFSRTALQELPDRLKSSSDHTLHLFHDLTFCQSSSNLQHS